MKHFIKNLVLLPFKLAWDAFLILVVVVLQLVWLALIFSICGIPIALILIFGSILVGSDLMICVLLPSLLLLFLKNPWPPSESSTSAQN